MEAYFYIFVTYEYNNYAKLLPIIEFGNNNAKTHSISCTSLLLNYRLKFKASHKEDIYL